jgi:CDP-glycerol glycerophosphotransferase (TagB/SpsB family)
MPTWRKGLLPDKFVNGQRAYYGDFIKTKFFKFYNGLLTNEKLLDALEKQNYKLQFILHPGLITQLEDFKSTNKNVTILQPPYDFTKIINETKIFITDYSSIFFDFAYTNIPIIYSQFDRKTFFTRQKYSETFWTYENDGFGPISETLDETCEKIIDRIEHKGEIERKYKERYENAFPYHDKNFCQRAANATKLLDEQ